LLLVHNLDARSFYGINPSFWAIAVEAQLYLLFPLLVALVAKLGWNRTLLCIGAIEVSMRTFFSVYTTTTELILPRWFTNSPLIYWYSWSIGAYLADAFLQARPLPFRRAPFYFWFILVLLSYFIRPLVAFRFLLASLFTVTVISKLLTESKGSDIALPRYFRPLRTIGHLSYSLYLLHQPFISLMPMLFSESSINSYMRELFIFIVCTLSIIIIAPLSWFYYRFCEIPSVSLGKWIVQKTRADRTQSVRGPR
jgi:peptidoglycan/LPS O-acetylase OafA/YrhL